MASKAAAVACHVASGIRGAAPCFPRRRGCAGDAATTTPATARTRPLLRHAAAAGPSGHRILRRGLAMISGCHSPGPEDDDYDPLSDPYAPNDPETCFDYGEEDLASEEAMWAMYEQWCAFHGVKRGRDDMLWRFGGFMDSTRQIHEFNKSGASFTQGLNIIGDATPEERAKFLRRQVL